MQIKAISILNTEYLKDGRDKFVNAAFAVTSDNVALAKSFNTMINNQPTYTPIGITAYLHATAYGVASAIRHSKQNGYERTEEEIINALVDDIRIAIKEEGDSWVRPGTVSGGPQDATKN